MSSVAGQVPAMVSTATKAERRRAKRERQRLRKLQEMQPLQSSLPDMSEQSELSKADGDTKETVLKQSLPPKRKRVHSTTLDEPKHLKLEHSRVVELEEPEPLKLEPFLSSKTEVSEQPQLKQPPSSQATQSKPQPAKPVFLSESEWHPSRLRPDLQRLSFSKGYEAFDIKE